MFGHKWHFVALMAVTGGLGATLIGCGGGNAPGRTTRSSVDLVSQIPPLTLNATDVTIAAGASYQVSYQGGVSPYSFQVSGGGNINPQGHFTAPNQPGLSVVSVRDSVGQSAAMNIGIAPLLRVSPASVELAVGNTSTFIASGGVPPFTFSVVSGDGSLSFETITGTFTAPMTSGVSTLRARDHIGQTTDVTITIRPSLALTMTANAVISAGTVGLGTTGGVAPYQFTLLSGDGMIDSQSFIASSEAGIATVSVTDALGNVSTRDIQVVAPVAISPASTFVQVGSELTVSGSGGLSPYTFELISGPGSLLSNKFSAPDEPGTSLIQVVDQLGQVDSATLITYAALTLNPGSAASLTNGTIAFNGAGGLPPYTYNLQSGGGSLSSNGEFIAPSTAGTSVVKITDSLANSTTATITVTAPAPTFIALAPTSHGLWGGGTLAISGQNFQDGAAVSIGATSCPSVSFTGPTQLTCVVPRMPTGVHSVTVTNPDNQSVTLPSAFTVQTFVYFALQANPGGVAGFAVNPTSGGLSATSGSPYTSGGNTTYGISISPNGKFVYAANYSSNSIARYSVNAQSGALTYLGATAVAAGPATPLVDPSNRFLLIAHYGGCAKYSVYAINNDSGLLTAVAGSPFQDIPCQANSGGVVVSSDSRFAYFVNYSSNSLSAFAMNPTTGVLTRLSVSPIIANGLSAPDTIAIHPTQNYFYVSNATNPGSVSAFAFSNLDGAVSTVANVSTTKNSSVGSGIRVSPDGQNLYFANKGSGFVTLFGINGTTGAPSLVGSFNSATQPQDIAVDPSNSFLYTANTSDSNSNAYSVNSSGALTGLTPATYALGKQGALMCIGH